LPDAVDAILMRILQVLNDAARQRIKYENVPLLAGGGKDLSVGAELQVKYSAWKGNDCVIKIRAKIMSTQKKSDQILM
jgi:hypothetical protein